MCGGEVVHAEAHHLPFGGRGVRKVGGADLTARVAEVLRQEGVEDGVDAGVSVGQAVGNDAEGEGGVVQREGAELHPHGDDVMGHPADGEGGDNQDDGLSRLRTKTSVLINNDVISQLVLLFPSQFSGPPAQEETNKKYIKCLVRAGKSANVGDDVTLTC